MASKQQRQALNNGINQIIDAMSINGSPVVIEVRSLTKKYNGILAVNCISFTVQRGSITALVGGNGAGKTTTLSMLLGLLLPSEGEINILGADMLTKRHLVLPRMNFSSPYVGMPARLTVSENLTVYANLYGLDNVKDRVTSVAKDLQILDTLKTQLGNLSSGQKTRVSLAKALINEPELLILDEPTASLDPESADWARGHLESYQLRTGATLLLASHNMGEVERLCHKVLIMKDGTIVDEGSPQRLIANYDRKNLEEVFLDIARDRTHSRDFVP